MSSIRVTTNFRDDFGTDLGTKLITKDYLMSVYPGITQEIGKTPELWTWGDNGYNRLGINVLSDIRSTPVTTFAGGTNWRSISTGRDFAGAIKTDGTLWMWGCNHPVFGVTGGQLGINNYNTNRSTPVTTFAGGTNWKQVACGYRHTAAIKTDGTLWAWGYNYNGALGNRTLTNTVTPVTTFAGGTNWKQVSCNGNSTSLYTAAIKTDGTLWTWGAGGSNGRLGINATGNRSTPVTTFAGGTNWKQVSVGGQHMAAIKTDGTLWTWGRNSYGSLGNNLSTNAFADFDSPTPITTFAGGTNWKQVSAGGQHTAAIKTDGTLWVWGYNGGSLNRGQLGTNDQNTRETPVTTFSGGNNWKQVACGYRNTAAIKTDGTLWTWGGIGATGVLGNAQTTDRCTPVTTFAGGTNWKQVSIGNGHTGTIRSTDFI